MKGDYDELLQTGAEKIDTEFWKNKFKTSSRKDGFRGGLQNVKGVSRLNCRWQPIPQTGEGSK